MAVNIRRLINDVLAKEGGYVDHPADKGGPTNFGITQATLSRYLERVVTPDEVTTSQTRPLVVPSARIPRWN
jgi:lysozyme family protein